MPKFLVWLCSDLGWYEYEILYSNESGKGPAKGDVEENRHDLVVQ